MIEEIWKHKVAAKTGTSQKFDILDENGNSYLRVSSTVAYAPSDEGGIAVIIVADEPMSSVKYGSVVVAPYVSELLNVILPYLEYPSEIKDEEIEIPPLVGMSIEDAQALLKNMSLDYTVIGNGNSVISQSPKAPDKQKFLEVLDT